MTFVVKHAWTFQSKTILPQMQGPTLLGGINVLHCSFPADADQEYRTQGELSYIAVTVFVNEGCPRDCHNIVLWSVMCMWNGETKW